MDCLAEHFFVMVGRIATPGQNRPRWTVDYGLLSCVRWNRHLCDNLADGAGDI
jgi:hypothetical protein